MASNDMDDLMDNGAAVVPAFFGDSPAHTTRDNSVDMSVDMFGGFPNPQPDRFRPLGGVRRRLSVDTTMTQQPSRSPNPSPKLSPNFFLDYADPIGPRSPFSARPTTHAGGSSEFDDFLSKVQDTHMQVSMQPFEKSAPVLNFSDCSSFVPAPCAAAPASSSSSYCDDVSDNYNGLFNGHAPTGGRLFLSPSPTPPETLESTPAPYMPPVINVVEPSARVPAPLQVQVAAAVHGSRIPTMRSPTAASSMSVSSPASSSSSSSSSLSSPSPRSSSSSSSSVTGGPVELVPYDPDIMSSWTCRKNGLPPGPRLSKEHREQIFGAEHAKRAGRNLYQCKLCGKKTGNPRHHINTHTAHPLATIYRYYCVCCGDSFSQPGARFRHFHNVHRKKHDC